MRMLLFVLCGIPSLPLLAQHCGYDFASIIVVHPHADGDTAVIDGLRVTLLDSNNVPILRSDDPHYLFKPNNDPAACGLGDHGFMSGYSCCFPFAKNNYVLVIPTGYDTGTMRILIQDERDPGPLNKRRDRWPTRFRQQVVQLDEFDNYRLCGTYNDLVYPELHDRPQYHPVEVILVSR